MPMFGTQVGQPKQTLEQRAMSARIASRVASELAKRDWRQDEIYTSRARGIARFDTSNPLNAPEIKNFVRSIGSLLPNKTVTVPVAGVGGGKGSGRAAQRSALSRAAPRATLLSARRAASSANPPVATAAPLPGGEMEPELWRPELAVAHALYERRLQLVEDEVAQLRRGRDEVRGALREMRAVSEALEREVALVPPLVSKALALEDRLVAAAASAAVAADAHPTPAPAAAAAAADDDEAPAADLSDVLREQLRRMDELVRERAGASAAAPPRWEPEGLAAVGCARPYGAAQPPEQRPVWGGLRGAHGPRADDGRDAAGPESPADWALAPPLDPHWLPPAGDSANDAACGRVAAEPASPTWRLPGPTAHSGRQAPPAWATAAAHPVRDSDVLRHSGDVAQAAAQAARTSRDLDSGAGPGAAWLRDGGVDSERAGTPRGVGSLEDDADSDGSGHQDARDNGGADSDADADSDVDPVLQRARLLLRALGQMGA